MLIDEIIRVLFTEFFRIMQIKKRHLISNQKVFQLVIKMSCLFTERWKYTFLPFTNKRNTNDPVEISRYELCWYVSVFSGLLWVRGRLKGKRAHSESLKMCRAHSVITVIKRKCIAVHRDIYFLHLTRPNAWKLASKCNADISSALFQSAGDVGVNT